MSKTTKNSVDCVLRLESQPEVSSLELIFRQFASHINAGISYQHYVFIVNQSENL